MPSKRLEGGRVRIQQRNPAEKNVFKKHVLLMRFAKTFSINIGLWEKLRKDGDILQKMLCLLTKSEQEVLV